MNIVSSLKKPGNRLFISLILCFTLLAAPFANAAEMRPTEKIRIKFSEAVEKSVARTAAALDKTVRKLAQAIDKTDNLSVEVHSSFYDSRIRRYFVSFSGHALFQGKLPWKIDKDSYIITSNSEVSVDLYVSGIRQSRSGLSFNYDCSVVVSLDRMAYELLKKTPHIAASGALSPAFDLLTEFLSQLNIGVLSEAISETFRSFSAVAFTRLVNDMIKASAQNQGLKNIFKQTMKDRSLLSFLALQIFRCASISLVSVTGASLGAAVGSVIAPGVGSVVGGYMGSQILTVVAKIIVYQITAKLPLKRNLKRMLDAHHMLVKNPGDEVARQSLNDAQSRIEKNISSEFTNEKFKLFEILLKEIDMMASSERLVMVPMLKNIQTMLQNKVINDGDWYYARKYHVLKQSVEKWGLQSQVVFTVTPPANR
ncbi:MAG: hypothetical protein CVV42_13455 [Candidatus Riflebacteria bacterium HGW-Riflebacteria-2]|jgi:hypothetical protein|nr:MAG: hypothetical protein CVV42_13455 [Candidatus Riflebacteria bacterium HGW-Riflebacteria-2]